MQGLWVLEHGRSGLPPRAAGGPGEFPAVPVDAGVRTCLHQTLPQESSQHPTQVLGVGMYAMDTRARQR